MHLKMKKKMSAKTEKNSNSNSISIQRYYTCKAHLYRSLPALGKKKKKKSETH